MHNFALENYKPNIIDVHFDSGFLEDDCWQQNVDEIKITPAQDETSKAMIPAEVSVDGVDKILQRKLRIVDECVIFN